jgi:hypothetical protein
MRNEKEIKDIKGLNVLFFTLIHPITLTICIATTFKILNANTIKDFWNAFSIGALISIPIIYLLDTLRKKRINQIKAIYSSDDSTINNYENKKNRIAGAIILVIIIGVISNNIFKLNNTTVEENKSSNTPNYDTGENLKTQNDVNQYALKKAEYYCGEWAKAQSKVNETNRRNSESVVNEQILGFTYDLRSVLQGNDLPDSYSEPAFKVFIDKTNACCVSRD